MQILLGISRLLKLVYFVLLFFVLWILLFPAVVHSFVIKLCVADKNKRSITRAIISQRIENSLKSILRLAFE